MADNSLMDPRDARDARTVLPGKKTRPNHALVDPDALAQHSAAMDGAMKPKRVRHPKVQSRPQRWAAALASAREAFDALEAAASDLEGARAALEELVSEYGEWRDNLPDSFSQTALAEKLEAICELDLSSMELDVSDVQAALDEAEGLELPRGFGRD